MCLRQLAACAARAIQIYSARSAPVSPQKLNLYFTTNRSLKRRGRTAQLDQFLTKLETQADRNREPLPEPISETWQITMCDICLGEVKNNKPVALDTNPPAKFLSRPLDKILMHKICLEPKKSNQKIGFGTNFGKAWTIFLELETMNTGPLTLQPTPLQNLRPNKVLCKMSV